MSVAPRCSYLYKEGMKLAARYKAEEEALKAELKVRSRAGTT